MKKILFKNAYYLKLGKQGKWEDVLIEGTKARIGWVDISLDDINNRNWQKIKFEIEKDYKIRGKKTGATQDFNALKLFCEATIDDIFITFHYGKLYWCFLDNTKVQEDNVSKYRTTKIKWNSTDINGKPLNTDKISGKITKTQGFRATLCKIDETETLSRIINSEKNALVNEIEMQKSALCKSIERAVMNLHWSDFEILTDIIFRQSGWHRTGKIGGNMKDFDLELEDLITKEKFKVQVKSKAGVKEFEEYAEKFEGLDFHKLFFVVFKPEKSLVNYNNNYENVQILSGLRLAEFIVDLGLTNWVLQKIT